MIEEVVDAAVQAERRRRASDEDWQHIEVLTRGPTGNAVNSRELLRATWCTRGSFVVVTVGPDQFRYTELWIPLSLVVEIRVVRSGA